MCTMFIIFAISGSLGVYFIMHLNYQIFKMNIILMPTASTPTYVLFYGGIPVLSILVVHMCSISFTSVRTTKDLSL